MRAGKSGRPPASARAAGNKSELPAADTPRHADLHLRLGPALMGVVVSSLSEGVVVQAADGTVVDANPAAERILGLSREQILGRTSADPRWRAVREDGSDYPGDDHPAMRCLRTGEPQHGHVMGVDAPAQGRRWLRINADPVRDPVTLQILGVVTLFADITGERSLRSQLQSVADAFEDLYENAPCGYHALDAQGRFLRINQTSLSWLGCTRDEVIGKLGPRDFMTDEGRALFAATFPKLRSGQQLHGIEYDLVSRDGTRRRVSLRASAVFDCEGRFVSTRSILFDVTAAREREQQAQTLLREQRAMLDTEMIGIVKLRDRNAVWINRGMHRIFGYASGELEGQSARLLYESDEDFAALGAQAYPVLARGDSFRTQLRMRRKDGTPIWVDMSGVQLGEHESLWMMDDITSMKDQHDAIEHVALHDVLTDLPNRRLLSQRIEAALAASGPSGRRFAVCYLDLDGFKPVNDEYGHAAGDRLLKEAGQRLLGCVRSSDTVARLGGDEFVLLLTELPAAGGFVPIVRRAISELRRPFALRNGVGTTVSASIGVALFPDDASDKGLLLRLADQAMYEAKRSGRNRWVRAAQP